MDKIKCPIENPANPEQICLKEKCGQWVEGEDCEIIKVARELDEMFKS